MCETLHDTVHECVSECDRPNEDNRMTLVMVHQMQYGRVKKSDLLDGSCLVMSAGLFPGLS